MLKTLGKYVDLKTVGSVIVAGGVLWGLATFGNKIPVVGAEVAKAAAEIK